MANRVKTIKDLSESSQWKYVPTTQNPGDIASRGSTASQLLDCTLWTSGPSFLWENDIHTPQSDVEKLSREDLKFAAQFLLQTVLSRVHSTEAGFPGFLIGHE